MEEKTTYGIAY